MSTNNLSIIQKPVNNTELLPAITNWNPLIGVMVFKDANISALFYYKLGLDVHEGASTTGTLVAKYRQRRNGYSDDIANNKARAFFDVRGVMNTQLVNTVYDQNILGAPFESIHEVGRTAYDENSDGTPEYYIFSENGNLSEAKTQIGRYTLNVFESYATSTSTNVTDIHPSTAVATTHFFLRASLPLNTPRFINGSGAVDTDYIQGVAFADYQLKSISSKFLSDNPSIAHNYESAATGNQPVVFIQDYQYHTLAFLNGEANFNSMPQKFFIRYYNGTTQLNSTFLDNTVANGGSNPEASSGETTTNARYLIYFGCGPANLEGFDAGGLNPHKPSNNAGYTHYIIRAFKQDATTSQSHEVIFVREDSSCKGYVTRRLAWRNSLGCWDYFNFKMKSVDSTNIERNEFSTIQGTFDGSKYRYNDWQRGRSVRATTAKRTETLNTDFIDEAHAILIEKLLMSTDVYVVKQKNVTDYTEPVMVVDKSFIRKTVANDKKIQYTVKIEYANNVNTNS